jgi:hypothetical protein
MRHLSNTSISNKRSKVSVVLIKSIFLYNMHISVKKLLLFCAILLVMAGCKKTDNPNAANATLILGSWKDGPQTTVYYVAGKEVYRETLAAPSVVSLYYQFTLAGMFNQYALQTDNTYVLYNAVKYSLSNSNNTITFSTDSGSYSGAIAFPDDNTLIITTTANSGVTYTQNGTLHTADTETDMNTLIRMK